MSAFGCKADIRSSLNGPRLKRYDCSVLSLGGGNEAARVHQFTQQRGSHVAARCASAAGGDPVVGFLHYASPDTFAHIAEAVRRGLKEAGYVEGQNVTIEYRWADGHYDRLPALAAELVHRQVTVITAGGNVAAQAAKAATAVIPIVFTSGADPVWSGLVQSLSRPGANLTGASSVAAELAVKRLEVIRELLPQARTVAMIVNPNYPGAEFEMAEVEAAGRVIGPQSQKVIAGDVPALETAFATISQMRVDAVTVGTDGFFITRREQIVPWPHATRCPASTRFQIIRPPAASRVTAPASPMRIDKRASTPDGFSKGPSRPTCPSRNRSSSS